MSVELDSGFTRDEVRKRYEKYAVDHHGDIDIPGLCETMVAFGERRAIQAMTEFSDILPRISRIEERVGAIRKLLLALQDEDLADDDQGAAVAF